MVIKKFYPRTMNKKDIDIVVSSLHFYASKLLKPWQSSKLMIDLHFFNKMQYEGYMEEFYRFEYDINIRVNSIKKMLITAAHEMVHVEQHVNRRLVEFDNNMIKFDNILYRWDDLDYKNEPWEIEAYKLEKELYNEFAKENDYET